MKQLSECSPYAGCTASAPMAIVNCYRKELLMPEYAEIDMSACTENILLETEELGLGSVWLGIVPLRERMKTVGKILNIPDSLEVFAIIPCGYPVSKTQQQNHFDENRVFYID